MSTKITVVTIVLNDQENIEKTICSVLSQDIEFEYIVIDGDSDDSTMDVIEHYRNNIDILLSEKDNGIYNAMNKAIDLARGEWICFMNSGDWFYDSNVLKNIESSFEQHLDVIYGDHEVRYKKVNKIISADNDIEKIWKGMLFSHQSCFVKRSVLQHYKFNEVNNITADYELFYKCFQAHKKFQYIPLVVSSISTGGISDIKRIDSIVSRWNVIEKSFIVNMYYLKLVFIESIKPYIKRILGRNN